MSAAARSSSTLRCWRADILALLAEVEQLRARVARMEAEEFRIIYLTKARDGHRLFSERGNQS